MTDGSPLLVAQRLRKQFGAVEALRGVDFEIGRGEIVGFAGDNGAGKSTVMKIVAGSLHPTSGELFLNGELIDAYSPTYARSRGIEMVYQDLSLCDNLDVRENIFLGREPKRSLLRLRSLAHDSMTDQAAALLARLEITVSSLLDPVATFSGGQRQAAAICRALAFRPHLVIMDEPTAALSLNAVEPLLRVIKRLPSEGASVMLVSHRLSDLLTTTDRIYVLRNGRIVANLCTAETSEEEVLHLMAGVTPTA